jgi:hypothetical protein
MQTKQAEDGQQEISDANRLASAAQNHRGVHETQSPDYHGRRLAAVITGTKCENGLRK